MKDPANLSAGDMLLVHGGKSIVALGITEFMREYCRINGYKYEQLYHHAALVVWDRGQLRIAEAVGRGWQVRPPLEAYSLEEFHERVDVFRPSIDWSSQEVIRLSDLAIDYSEKITRYDYANFLFQMYWIRHGVWLGPKGAKAEGRLYCSEGVATIFHKLRADLCDEPWRYNPMDLYLEPGIQRIDK